MGDSKSKYAVRSHRKPTPEEMAAIESAIEGDSVFADDEPIPEGASRGRGRMSASISDRRSFARIPRDLIPAFSKAYGTTVGLHLEMLRLSGSAWARKREGWLPLRADILDRIGLRLSGTRSRTVDQLCQLGVLEARRSNGPGSRLEYRLNPNWGKPVAEVVDLATAKEERGQ